MNAPPVFILDAHRLDKPWGQEYKNNSYQYVQFDFPSAEDFKQLGIKKIVYLNESERKGFTYPNYISVDYSSDMKPSDMKPIVENWLSQGLEILYTGVKPWEDVDYYKFANARKFLDSPNWDHARIAPYIKHK